MKLYAINTGYFKLDGGAMFGVVPKSGPLNPQKGDFRTLPRKLSLSILFFTL
jgi:hypothetical protein